MKRILFFLLIPLLLQQDLFGQVQSLEEVLNQVLAFQTEPGSNEATARYYADASAERRDLGIAFIASTRHKFGEGFIDDDLGQTNIQTFYKAGLQWDILREGFFQNRAQADRYEILASLEGLTAEQKAKSESYFAQFAFAGYLFDKLLLSYYQSRFEALKIKRPLYASLREEGYFTNNELLQLQSRLEETRVQIDILTSSNQSFKLVFEDELAKSFSDELTQIDEMPSVEIYRLLDDMNSSTSLKQLSELQKSVIEKPGYWKDEVSLRATLNYNHQVSFIDTRRDYVSVGLNLTVPLSTNRSSINTSYRARINQIDSEYELEIKNRKKELLMLYQEYSYKQKQRTNTQSTLDILEEKLRALHLQKVSVNTELPITDASLLKDDYLSVQIEHDGLARQMTQLLLKMNLLLLDHTITEYLEFNDRDEMLTVNMEVE